MPFTVKLRKGNPRGQCVGTFGPFRTQTLAKRQGQILADQAAPGIVVVVEPTKRNTKRKRNQMDYKVTWPGGHRWFGSEQAAVSWARKEQQAWLTQGAPRAPEYRVVYQPSGKVVQTLPAKDRNYRRAKVSASKWTAVDAELVGRMYVKAAPGGGYYQILKQGSQWALFHTDDKGHGPKLGAYSTLKAAKAAAGRKRNAGLKLGRAEVISGMSYGGTRYKYDHGIFIDFEADTGIYHVNQIGEGKLGTRKSLEAAKKLARDKGKPWQMLNPTGGPGMRTRGPQTPMDVVATAVNPCGGKHYKGFTLTGKRGHWRVNPGTATFPSLKRAREWIDARLKR